MNVLSRRLYSRSAALALSLSLFVASTLVASANDSINVASGAVGGQTFVAPDQFSFVGINPVLYVASLAVNSVDAQAPAQTAQGGFVQGSTGPVAPPAAVGAQHALVFAELRACSTPLLLLECDLAKAKNLLANTNADLIALGVSIESALQTTTDPSTDGQVILDSARVRAEYALLKPYYTATLSGDYTAIVPSSLTTPADAASYAKDSADLATFNTNVANLTTAYAFLLESPLTTASFQRSYTETCKSQGLGGRTTTLTLTKTSRTDKTQSTVYTVTLTCSALVTLSTGVILYYPPQKTFTAQTNNNGGSSTATPTATVQSATQSAVGFFGFTHFRLGHCGENCFYVSPGAGLATGGQTNFAYGVGVSYGFFNYGFLTLGGAIVPTTRPQAGYEIGKPIAVGAAVPTSTSSQGAVFLGLTFGPQH